MDFRITQQQSIQNAIRHAQMRQREIGKLQDQLATGLRIVRPSDAPGDWSHLTANKAAVERMDVELQNISTVRQRLNHSVASLTEAGELLVRARELALSGVQSQHRETLAVEVDRIIESMLTLANETDGGQVLYGGTASHRDAFVVSAVDAQGRPLAVDYQGADAYSLALVGVGNTAHTFAPGVDAFVQSARATSDYLGTTGAAAGQGTDSGRGVGALTVRHTSTTYSGGGIVPGASSPGGDTVIGPPGTHTLTVEDHPTLGRVVRLNGGGPVPFDALSTDLEVTGPHGERVFVDLSGVPGAFTGDVDITANGTLSVDGGLSEVPIAFSTAQLVTDSGTGQVTVVDSTGIRNAGTDRIEYRGTAGAFEALIQLRDDLRAADDWSTPELVQIMDARIEDLHRVHTQLLDFVGEQSVELASLETLESRTRELRLVTQEAVIETENADIADVIVRLQTEQNHLQFIYAATASMSQTSLLDFIS